MSFCYSNELGILEQTIDKYMGLAEDIFTIAQEFAAKHEENEFQGYNKISYISAERFVDRVKQSFRNNIANSEDINIEDAGIRAAFVELVSAFEKDPFLKRLGINEIEAEINGADSHLSINGDYIYDEDSFREIMNEAYIDAVAEIYYNCAADFSAEYQNSADFSRYFENYYVGYAADLYNEGKLDECFEEIAAALADDAAPNYGKCPRMLEIFEDSFSEMYEFYSEEMGETEEVDIDQLKNEFKKAIEESGLMLCDTRTVIFEHSDDIESFLYQNILSEYLETDISAIADKISEKYPYVAINTLDHNNVILWLYSIDELLTNEFVIDHISANISAALDFSNLKGEVTIRDLIPQKEILPQKDFENGKKPTIERD